MNVFLSAVLRLALVKRYWLSSQMARAMWDMSTNIPMQIRMFKILNTAAFAGIISADQRFPFRYLTKNYLSTRFTVTERATSFLHHYSRLNTLISVPQLLQVLHRDLTLFERRESGNVYRIAMCLSRASYSEGELSLNLEVNGTVVFVLSFTIIPGRVIALEDRDVLMISRLQGKPGCQRQIRDVTKALHEVAPGALLVTALQGVAKAFGVSHLAGVCAADHFCYQEAQCTSFEKAYDDFWVELGATRNTANFFLCTVPLREKPLLLIRNGHKARTKKKRKFKEQIAESVCQRFRDGCTTDPGISNRAVQSGEDLRSYQPAFSGYAVDSQPSS